jgi:folate-binding protein YgfZ
MFWAHTEPGRLAPLLAWLERMRFASVVEVADRSDDYAVILAGGPEAAPKIVPRNRLEEDLGERRAGTWASEAVRIAAGQPRIFLDTDDATIPNEISMPDGQRLGAAVHLRKGCYRGQETVARVHNLGRPPRRLTLLHLDGSVERLPPVGSPLLDGQVTVGRVGTSAIHYELGPIALALVKRGIPIEATLDAAGIPASQQVIVDPDVGLHVRPTLGR